MIPAAKTLKYCIQRAEACLYRMQATFLMQAVAFADWRGRRMT